MYLSKRKAILAISVLALVFFFTYNDVKSQDVKITDVIQLKLMEKKSDLVA